MLDPLYFGRMSFVFIISNVKYAFQICKILDFGYHFQNEIANSFYGPSISHKDDHFAKKTALKLDEK